MLTAAFLIRIAGVQTRPLALPDVAGVRGTRFATVIVAIEMDWPWMLPRWSPLSHYLKKKRGPWYKSLDRHEFGFHQSSQAAEELTSCALLVVKSQSTG